MPDVSKPKLSEMWAWHRTNLGVDNDGAAALAAIDAVLAVHYEAHNDAARSPLCQGCKGAPGVHPCGCWRDEQDETVCGACVQYEGRGRRVLYPCPTVLAVLERIDVEG
jgi:hypothetical protein